MLDNWFPLRGSARRLEGETPFFSQDPAAINSARWARLLMPKNLRNMPLQSSGYPPSSRVLSILNASSVAICSIPFSPAPHPPLSMHDLHVFLAMCGGAAPQSEPPVLHQRVPDFAYSVEGVLLIPNASQASQKPPSVRGDGEFKPRIGSQASITPPSVRADGA